MSDEREPEALDFPALDDEAGVAPAQTLAAADALVRSAVARVQKERAAAQLFVPLEGEPGPAAPLRAEQGEALVRAAVREARAHTSPRRTAWGVAPWAGALGLLFALGGGAYAAVAYLDLIPSEPATGEPAPRRGRGQPSRAHEPRPPARTAPPADQAGAPSAHTEFNTNVSKGRASPRGSADERRPAADWLRRANQLRAAARFDRAEQLYSRIMQEADDPNDVYVATVAAAGLRLEHLDRPKEALRLYRQALRQRPAGPLAPAVRQGIAEAHRALDEPHAEAAALRALLEAHPDHLLATPARTRLRELGRRVTD